MSQTARLHIPYPELTDGPDGADVPYWLKAMALVVDSAAVDDQGILSSRPPSSGATAGVKGRYYMVKGDPDTTQNGILYRDNGAGWDIVGSISPGSVGTAALQDAAVTSPKINGGAIGTAQLNDLGVTTAKLAAGAVTAAKIDNTLKPSTGAGASTESLRALGVVAGTALAGDDARVALLTVPSGGRLGVAAQIEATGIVKANAGLSYEVVLGNIPGVGTGAGLSIGGDVGQYRFAAGAGATDQNWIFGGSYVRINNDVNMRSNSAHIYMGATDDSIIGRFAAGQISISKASGAAVVIGDNGSGKPVIYLGSGLADYWYVQTAGEINTASHVAINGDLRHAGTHVGFFGHATATQQTVTGAKGGNVALADLLSKLQATGIIIDSTT